MEQAIEADIVIVGAGSAGCVLANRLSADPSVRVVLVEAGGEATHPWIRVPIGYARTIADPSVNWCYGTEPEPSLGGRRVFYPLGKVVGGSSSINGLVWVHGQPEDYDGWAAAAGPSWGREPMAAALRKVEAAAAPLDGSGRGKAGKVAVRQVDTDHALVKATLAAFVEAGVPCNPDYNAGVQEGIGPLQATLARGRRVSAATAYLEPVRSRPNLRVVTRARVRCIEFDGGRAGAVVAASSQGILHIAAATEVIISAGAIHTPQLLMLSGIGPKEALQRLGIAVLVDAGDVGANLQDHAQA